LESIVSLLNGILLLTFALSLDSFNIFDDLTAC
jgi:hypothetical protein